MEYFALVVALVALVSSLLASRSVRELEKESDLEFRTLHDRADLAVAEIDKRAMKRRSPTRKTMLPPPPGGAANDNDEIELDGSELEPVE